MDDTDMDLEVSSRAEELQVLQSIYPDYVTDCTENTVRLEVPVELGDPRRILLDPTDSAYDPSSADIPSLELSYLPPILLTVKLPADYPLAVPPEITFIHATSSWLSPTLLLQRLLVDSWTEGESILCTWVELVRSGEMLEQLGLADASGTIRCVVVVD